MRCSRNLRVHTHLGASSGVVVDARLGASATNAGRKFGFKLAGAAGAPACVDRHAAPCLAAGRLPSCRCRRGAPARPLLPYMCRRLARRCDSRAGSPRRSATRAPAASAANGHTVGGGTEVGAEAPASAHQACASPQAHGSRPLGAGRKPCSGRNAFCGGGPSLLDLRTSIAPGRADVRFTVQGDSFLRNTFSSQLGRLPGLQACLRTLYLLHQHPLLTSRVASLHRRLGEGAHAAPALAASPQAPSQPAKAPASRGRPYAAGGTRLARGREPPLRHERQARRQPPLAARPTTHRRWAGQASDRSGAPQQITLPPGMGARQPAAGTPRRRQPQRVHARSGGAAVLLAALLAALLLAPLAAADESKPTREGET